MPDDPEVPEPQDGWHLDTRAIRAGRQFSRDSLAPVLFPSTTYEVASVDDHARMAGVPRTEPLLLAVRQPDRAGVRGRPWPTSRAQRRPWRSSSGMARHHRRWSSASARPATTWWRSASSSR